MGNRVYSNRAKVHTIYKLKDGTRVPGVTTVLNELNKPALIHWAWSLGTKGIDYRVHRDELADIGTLTHRMILCYFKSESCDTSEYSKRQIDKAENCLLSFYEWEKHHKVEPLLVEKALISERHRFGGTVDFIGDIDGVRTLMDFKTGKAIYDEFFYQLAGYSIAAEENGLNSAEHRILRIGREESEGSEERVKRDLSLDKEIFLHALGVYQVKKAKKANAK